MAISDYILKHKAQGTLKRKLSAEPPKLPKAPTTKPTSLTNVEKVSSDKARGVTLSAAKPKSVPLLRQLASKVPFGFEKNVYDPIAKVGSALFPTTSDYMRQVVSEKPGLTQAELQTATLDEMTRSGAFPLVREASQLGPDTPIMDLPDFSVGSIRRAGGKAVGKVVGNLMEEGGQAAKRAVEATAVPKAGKNPSEYIKQKPVETPAIYEPGSSFYVDTSKVTKDQYLKLNFLGRNEKGIRGDKEKLSSMYEDMVKRQATPKPVDDYNPGTPTEVVPTQKPEERYDSMLTQFSGAEAGERIGQTRPDGTFAGYTSKRSSFPEWLPATMRNRTLLNKYLDNRTGSLNDFQTIKYRPGSVLAKLDDEVREKLYKDTGIDMRVIPDDAAALDDMARQYADEMGTVTVPPKLPPKPPKKLTRGSAPKPGGGIERGFITSVKEQVPITTRAEGRYAAPRSTAELAQKAANLVIDDIAEARRVVREESGEKMVAVASELIKSLARQADTATSQVTKDLLHKELSDVAHEAAAKLTQAGRDVQAARILALQTPEGQLRFFAREINKYNEANPTRKIPGLSKEEVDWVMKETKRIQAMPEGEPKAIAFKEFQDQMRQRIPSSLLDKLQSVWRAGLLTGLKTSGLNLASNVAHTTAEIAKDLPASMADTVMSWFTGKRTKGATLGGTLEGTKEGIKRGWTFWKTGYDPREIGRAYEQTQVKFKSKALQTYVDFVFRTIAGPDQPLYYGALRRSLAEQAKIQAKNEGLRGQALRKRAAELAENPTDEMVTYSTIDAETAVFLNQTALGAAAKKIQDIPGGKFAVPFARTPSAVAMQVLNYSPIGVPLEVGRQIGKGKFDQRMMANAIGRSATGLVPLWLGYQLFKEDMISLDYPKTERERELWKAEGRVANSVKIGDKWRSLQTLGPAGPVLLMGGHFSRAFKESGSPTAAMLTALAGTAKSFTEATFLRGLNDLIDAITSPERGATNFAASFISSWIPTIINDIARTLDTKERFTAGNTFMETVMNRIQARIPLLREGLQEQVDVIGRDVNRVGNRAEVMADPTRPSPDKSTPVTNELSRLTNAGYEVSPTRLGNKTGYTSLTPEQNTELWRKAGQLTNEKLNKLISKPEYRKLSDEEKAKYVNEYVTKSQVRARALMVIELTRGMTGEKLKQELLRLKGEKGGTNLLSESVWNEYQRLMSQ